MTSTCHPHRGSVWCLYRGAVIHWKLWNVVSKTARSCTKDITEDRGKKFCASKWIYFSFIKALHHSYNVINATMSSITIDVCIIERHLKRAGCIGALRYTTVNPLLSKQTGMGKYFGTHIWQNRSSSTLIKAWYTFRVFDMLDDFFVLFCFNFFLRETP